MTKEIIRFNKAYKTKELEELARSCGLEVVTGRGRHGVHIYSEFSGRSCPLPSHGSRNDLSFGVRRSVLRFIQEEVDRHALAA